MKPFGFIAAGLLAIAGALLWGVISWATNYEVGIIAWGIGLVVGTGAAACGSRGATSGLICALLALGSIGLGKYFAVDWALADLGGELAAQLEEGLNQETFNELKQDAEDLKGVKSDRDYAQFMTSHNYLESEPTEEEIAAFKADQEPMLKRIANNELTFEDWRDEGKAELKAIFAESRPNTFEAMKDSFSLFDLLWAFLGVSTAFRVGSGGSEEEE